LLVLAAACGEAAVTTQASGGPPRRTDEDAAPPPAAKAPPCDEAVLGQACANDPTTCELGAHPNVACNERLTCRGPNWELQRDAGACPSDCPDAPDAATSPCAAGAAALVRCAYEDDRTTCGCSRNADAGADAGYVWKCVQADAGCPSLRPPIGAPCVLPLTCDYGGCLFEDRPTMRCLGGYWNLAAPVCASP
jgi:hypothetical protein